MGCNGQGTRGGIFIEDYGTEVGAGSVQGASASGGAAPDDGHIAFDDFHLKLCGGIMDGIAISSISVDDEMIVVVVVVVVATEEGG